MTVQWNCSVKRFLRLKIVSVSLDDVRRFAWRPDVCAIVVDGDAVLQQGGHGVILALKRGLPSVAIVGRLRVFEPRSARAGFELARAGVDAIWIAGVEDHPALLRRSFESATLQSAAIEVASHPSGMAPRLLWGKVGTFFQRLPCLGGPLDLSRELGVSLPQLRSHLRREGFPTPKRFLAWCRVLLATKLLQDPARTTEGVGLWLNYSSGPSFRNACRRVAGAPPGQLRSPERLALMLGHPALHCPNHNSQRRAFAQRRSS